ncbi:hypothetical protein [Polaromonas eurypsychrophila]|uniref:Uncharacterized protein n=1 Tax=Polaromonas eurypsychrophila TaxID=1614635 RepID=A0A916SNJ7_9BURK|nr:hypothetical protein [Polaromonas eurypsychrophila]GGB09665.1 hypothetical protein GCM10011496_33210 [Polaromonas eurypsychrophila]
MKTICITGASQTDLHPVAHLLQQAGLACPQTVKRDDPIDMALWHEQVMSMAAEDAPGCQPISSPGRLWEQLANEIFIANIKSKVWGWADARSTWLLDFWSQFELRLKFVLVCVTPQQMLASAMAADTETVSVDAVMTTWQQHHQELLRFHHRHPQRSMLVDSRECAQHPQALIEHCAAKWKLPLSAANAALGQGYPEQDALALYLAHQLCQNYPQATSLQHELAATLTRLGEEEAETQAAPNVGTLVLPPEEIIASYRSLRDRTVELQQAQAAREELDTVNTRYAALHASHLQQLENSEIKLQESTKESQLLLLQLHQVQEELEGVFLKHEAANKRLDMLTQSNTALSGAKDALAKEKGELAAARDAEAQAKAAALASRDAEAQAKAEALAQRDALAKEKGELAAARDAEAQAKAAALASRDAEAKAKTEALAQRDALAKEKSALTARRDALEKDVAVLTQARDEQAKLASERQAKLKESTQEGELLLLQLHQVQEELEAIFLKHEAAQKQLDTLTQSNAALSAAKDALAREKGELIAARDAEAKAKAAALASRDAEAKAKTEALAQRDALAKEKSALTARRDALEKDLAARTTDLAAKGKDLAALTQARDEQAKLATDRLTKLEKATQEGELLLLQLYKVQQELENYVLQHEEGQKQLETAEARWQRMLKRNPNYCDYEGLELLSVQGEGATQTRWKLKNLETTGRSLPVFEFETILDQGVVGFVFSRPAGSSGPLLRWPGAPASQTELTFIPVATPEFARERAEALRDLALSDFDLLKTLARLLLSTLENPAALKAPAEFNADQLKTGLGRFIELIEKHAKASLRYDHIGLKREYVDPNYESLWLSLGNAAYRDQRWPTFEFRLSCANVRPGQFGLHPKFEFAEQTGPAQLEGWFAEAHDAFGPKLELRFALPNSIDVGVWQRVSENDRKLLVALLSRLPSMLAALKATGVQLQRPWDDWTKMLKDMQRIVASRLAPRKLIAPPPDQAPVPAPLPAVAAAIEAPVKKTPVNKLPVNKPHAKTARPATKRAVSAVRKSK